MAPDIMIASTERFMVYLHEDMDLAWFASVSWLEWHLHKGSRPNFFLKIETSSID